MHRILSISLLLTAATLPAQDIAGRWITIDDQTGKARSVVEISVRNGVASGKIVDIMDKSQISENCVNCPDDRKGRPMLGLEIIRNMKRSGNEWTGGTLLDPRPGKIYDGKIWMEDGTLKVRGYVAFFYRTQTWIREK